MKLPNIVVRILAGAVFVGLLLGGILVNEYTYVIIFSIITALCLYEFYGLIEKAAKVSVSKVWNILGGVFLFLGAYCQLNYDCAGILAFSPYILFIITLFVSELYLKRENPLKSLAYSLLGQAYIALPFALANSLVFDSTGGYVYIYLLALLAIVWIDDTFAYLTGMLFGKHRLFERISPKKSWEGFIGGAVFSIASSLIFSHFFGEISTVGWIGFSLVIITFGTWGDLIESLMKRTLGVKDSGNMIPGHGGILDRFDSTIMAIPAAVIYLSILKAFCA